jgi:hypothetical protein
MVKEKKEVVLAIARPQKLFRLQVGTTTGLPGITEEGEVGHRYLQGMEVDAEIGIEITDILE